MDVQLFASELVTTSLIVVELGLVTYIPTTNILSWAPSTIFARTVKQQLSGTDFYSEMNLYLF